MATKGQVFLGSLVSPGLLVVARRLTRRVNNAEKLLKLVKSLYYFCLRERFLFVNLLMSE